MRDAIVASDNDSLRGVSKLTILSFSFAKKYVSKILINEEKTAILINDFTTL